LRLKRGLGLLLLEWRRSGFLLLEIPWIYKLSVTPDCIDHRLRLYMGILVGILEKTKLPGHS
jgi:hypothetical protein